MALSLSTAEGLTLEGYVVDTTIRDHFFAIKILFNELYTEFENNWHKYLFCGRTSLILGWAMNKRGFALTGAILYTVALVLFPVYFMFVIVQMVLSYVGFATLKKIIDANNELKV